MISLLTAVAVAFIGVRNSRTMEASKVRASYLNYALQKIMDEYIKYDPVIDLSQSDSTPYVRLIEARFKECRASVRKVSPIVDPALLQSLNELEKSYNDIIMHQCNAQLRGEEPEVISADEYSKMLVDYINTGHKILKEQIEHLRIQLERLI